MKQIKVFIIEDELPVINKLRKSLAPLHCEVIPKGFNSEVDDSEDYTNDRDLLLIYRKQDYLEKFKDILIKEKDIDLFIVDISLEANKKDEKGIQIIHHLVENIDIYNKGKSKIIVLSRYGDNPKIRQQIDETKVTYISKDQSSDYSIVVGNYITKNLKLSDENIPMKTDDFEPNIDEPDNVTDENKSSWIKQIRKKLKKISGGIIRVWLNDNFFYPANYYLDKLILIVFGILFLGALAFALIGITSDFYNYFKEQFDTNKEVKLNSNNDLIYQKYSYESREKSRTDNPNSIKREVAKDTISSGNNKNPDSVNNVSDQKGASENKIKILEVVEHIFIYLLPLFILFGFYNFYSSTTAVRWRGDSLTTVDFDNSIKGINTSKTILLSALLSYTLINAIDRIFVNKETEIDSKILIAYGVFIIILMAFILLLNTEKSKGPEKNNKQN